MTKHSPGPGPLWELDSSLGWASEAVPGLGGRGEVELEQISRAAIFDAQIKSVWVGGRGLQNREIRATLTTEGRDGGKGELPAARRGVIWQQLCAT